MPVANPMTGEPGVWLSTPCRADDHNVCAEYTGAFNGAYGFGAVCDCACHSEPSA